MRRLVQFQDSARYVNLLFWLLVILAAYPFLAETRRGSILLGIGSSLVMFAGLYAAHAHRRHPWIVRGVGAAYFVVLWIDVFTREGAIDVVAIVASIAFYIAVIVAILRDIMSHRTVVRNTISGAVCVYLLLGFAWAAAYWLVEFLWPGSFRFPVEEGVLRWTDFLYLSYTTLTTLGYGDITPINDHARSLTSLQAICGVMYLGLLISRLVSAYKVDMESPDEESGER